MKKSKKKGNTVNLWIIGIYVFVLIASELFTGSTINDTWERISVWARKIKHTLLN